MHINSNSMLNDESQVQCVEAAPFWQRVSSDLADIMCFILIAYAVWKLGLGFPTSWPASQFGWVDHIAILINQDGPAIVHGMGYTLLFGLGLQIGLQGLVGTTFGEACLGIRLVTKDGHRPGLLRALLRAVIQVVLLLPFGLGYFWALADPDRQTLGDRICGTWLLRRRSLTK